MFSSKQKGATNAQSTNSISEPSSSCILDSGTHIEGTVRSSEDMRLDGQIKGDVYCEKRFVMGGTGKVEGKVNCLKSVTGAMKDHSGGVIVNYTGDQS